MFKSTNEYNKAIYKTLVYIRDNNSFPKSNNDEEKVDLGDVINLCNNRGFIEGVIVNKNIAGHYICDGQPRLTQSGLKFIENFI